MNAWLPQFGFEQPLALWALTLALVVAGFAWRSRRRERRRLWLATSLRFGALVTLVLALAQTTHQKRTDDLGVVFVIDRSASVGVDGTRRAETFVREALTHKRDDDKAGIVVFGRDAAIEASVQRDLQLGALTSVVDPDRTDIASALRTASSLLPTERKGRLVLLSDGEENQGDARREVQTLPPGQSLATVHLPRSEGAEMWLSDLHLPEQVAEDDRFELTAVARSIQPADAHLRVYRDEAYQGQVSVSLRGGGHPKAVTIPQTIDRSGLAQYRVVLEPRDPRDDTVTQNNTLRGAVKAEGRPRVLLATPEPARAQALSQVLERDGFDVDRRTSLPVSLTGLVPYEAIVLDGFPRAHMTSEQEDVLVQYVEDLGGGLIKSGGPRAFGPGGYHGSPLAEILPVELELNAPGLWAPVAILFVIDRSGSMGDGPGSELDIARQATIGALDLLMPSDVVGILAFDHGTHWAHRPAPLGDGQTTKSRVAAISVGGGTEIYTALDDAIEALRAVELENRHVILLSDGISPDRGFEELLGASVHEGITVSAVAIGDAADSPLMRDIASWGHGEFHYFVDATGVAAAFEREIDNIGRDFIIEEPLRVATGARSPATQGLEALPPLQGAVGTQRRPRATLALHTTWEDVEVPVLAHWQAGLGRVSAWTSDLGAHWAGPWVGTDAYTRVWTQLVRWTAGDHDAHAMTAQARIRDDVLHIEVEAFEPTGAYWNGLRGEAVVLDPERNTHRLPLRPSGPGRYTARLPAIQAGSWLASVGLWEEEQLVGRDLAHAAQPISPEHLPSGDGAALMTTLGERGGGGTPSDPALAFAPPEEPLQVPTPLAMPLIALAAVLLLLEVAVRRVDLDRRPAPAGAAAAVRAPDTTGASAPGAPPPHPRGAREPRATPAPTATSAQPRGEGAQSYVGGLLAARGKARAKMKQDPDEG